MWIANNKSNKITIEILLDSDRQIITVQDNAGGVREADLRLLIAPGATRNQFDQESIGIFGVGGKRAGVALGELVEIRTRYKKEKSLQIDIDNQWLESEDWNLAAYEIPNIAPGTTKVEISKLRQSFDKNEIEKIREHLNETYDWFINEGCDIKLNNAKLTGKNFEKWAFPQRFEPRQAKFQLSPTPGKTLDIEITGGLILDRTPNEDNYGVYVYCNHRLIVKELRSRDVGYFVSGEAGVPHPDASLCRVIVRLQGPPEVMPWNSSKSGINANHPTFSSIRPTLIGLVSYFSSLSRRTKNDWEKTVYPFDKGEIKAVDPADMSAGKKLVLPTLPRVKKLPRVLDLKNRNKKLISEQPWTLGLIEAMGIVDIIYKQKLDTKNRVALILLDSNFEIGMKEFIVNRTDLFHPMTYNDAKILHIFKSRHNVINEIKPHINISQTTLNKINHYYGLRNKLIHERATVGITDMQVNDYRDVIETVLKLLFNLKFPAK